MEVAVKDKSEADEIKENATRLTFFNQSSKVLHGSIWDSSSKKNVLEIGKNEEVGVAKMENSKKGNNFIYFFKLLHWNLLNSNLHFQANTSMEKKVGNKGPG